MKHIKQFEGYFLDVRNELRTLIDKRMVVFNECMQTLIDVYDFEYRGVNDLTNMTNNKLAVTYKAKNLLYSDELFKEIDKVSKKAQTYGAKASIQFEFDVKEWKESINSMDATFDKMKKAYDKYKSEYLMKRMRHRPIKINIILTIYEVVR